MTSVYDIICLVILHSDKQIQFAGDLHYHYGNRNLILANQHEDNIYIFHDYIYIATEFMSYHLVLFFKETLVSQSL